jgi:peptide deformylase
VFINPRIIQSPEINLIKQPRKLGKKASKKLEGCLSLPNIWGPVQRAPSLTLSFLDQQGLRHEQKFSNFLATIIQHESDHLDGILFPKRVLEQKGILYKSHKNEKNEDEFEEIEI